MQAQALTSCPHCTLIQSLPALPPAAAHTASPTHTIRCARCHALLTHHSAARSLAWPAALSLAALILFPLAMALPVLRIERMGHSSESTIWSGTRQMFRDGHIVIGLIVFTCSIIIPLAKILGIFTLCTGDRLLAHRPHRALTYRIIDWLGRWGMIDVLLVAILVAAVKLGDWVDVHPGPGIIAFAGVVILSLLASMTFDPRAIWAEPTPTP